MENTSLLWLGKTLAQASGPGEPGRRRPAAVLRDTGCACTFSKWNARGFRIDLHFYYTIKRPAGRNPAGRKVLLCADTLPEVLRELPDEALRHDVGHHHRFLLDRFEDADAFREVLRQKIGDHGLYHGEMIVHHFLPFLRRPIWVDAAEEGRDLIRV